METETITVSPAEAREAYLKYKEHAHYSTPIDREIQRVHEAIMKGRVVCRALASIKAAGVGDDGLPKLAIIRADAEECHLYLKNDGGARFSTRAYAPDRNRRSYIDMPAGSFADTGKRFRNHVAQTPLVPIHLRPRAKRGTGYARPVDLSNFHILFEAEWSRVPPRDPLLLRRIGSGDLWEVCAAWDLTEVERAVLAGRINA
jgi:hypothetical protein